MEPLWEWKWAYWDESLGRFEATPVWMTDAEACADFWAYSDQRTHKLEHTKRDRKGDVVAMSLVEPPPADVNWTREARRRQERSRYGLPPFVTPTYPELRRIWKEHPQAETRRLALEVQTARYAIAELEALAAEEFWHLDRDSTTADDGRKALARVRRRLMAELQRIGPVDDGRKRR